MKKYILAAVLAGLTLSPTAGPVMAAFAAPQQKSATKKRKSTGKTSAKKNARKTAAPKKETSSDVKRRQEATQKEIRLTKEQIKENDRSIKNGLNELGKLETDIRTSGQKIKETSGRIKELSGKIGNLETGIASNEKELEKLRTEYLKAVKKMRLARRGNSELAFVFASDNFNQALRRMRYLKQFSEWKDRQSSAIDVKTKQLKVQREDLAKARNEQNSALARQKADEAVLRKQHSRQDAIVAELRQNGEALKTHLSKKQAEANQLRNRIAALIAEEERKAAEEKARKEAARKAEQERIAREKAEREEAQRAAEEKRRMEEQERLLAENKEKEEAAADYAKAKTRERKTEKQSDSRKAEDKKKQEKKQDKKPKKESKKDSRKESKKNDKARNERAEYAEARKRSVRPGKGDMASVNTKGLAAASASASNFGAMKGSLPRPASGAFKITSRFGRQSLPDLPDVVYDNPGIDAEVSAGASALAVFSGKVSGVYMLPGYNTVVIVNHGNYYTVYGNIASPAVKVGQQVKAGQGLGSLAPDEDDRSRSSIHFEVWRNREKLNPLDWIR